MLNRLMFSDLLKLMEENLNEKLYITSNDDNNYVITDNGLNMDAVNFTQINFRVVDNTLIIPWFYLSRPNKGIGSKIMTWFIEFSKINDITAIEIRNVTQDKYLMKKLLDKFEFKIIKSGEFMDFRKILLGENLN